MTNPAYEIDRLILFALKNGLIGRWDVIPARNEIMSILNVSEPYEGDNIVKLSDNPAEILEKLLDYAAENNIIELDTITYRDLLDTRIMGCLMPRQSEVIENFDRISCEQGIKAATDWFYGISSKSNYIRIDRISKNKHWEVSTEYGRIEITINLSKPEKDPKAILEAGKLKKAVYPKCVLCLENVGYNGRVNHPARQNLRVIPVTLDNEQWFMQYSPYVYFNEHCIVFNRNHIPMKIDKGTFTKLLDFVEKLPHYFIGSNADLPIVGGSILSHDHFQGGNHKFPMELAPVEAHLRNHEYPDIKAGIVKWPMSVIRIWGPNKEHLVDLSDKILAAWRDYTDESVGIYAHSKEGGGIVCHNTITPIARINDSGEYEIDLVLRNNRTSREHPDGIFHPHFELHHIKKENIGLIEVMGLAVLPGRLDKELGKISGILSGRENFYQDTDTDDSLYKHRDWIDRLISENGTKMSEASAGDLIKDEMGKMFVEVLSHAGVFKRDTAGIAAFKRFAGSIGLVGS